MHVGTQQFNTSDEDLEYLARHGVFNKEYIKQITYNQLYKFPNYRYSVHRYVPIIYPFYCDEPHNPIRK